MIRLFVCLTLTRNLTLTLLSSIKSRSKSKSQKASAESEAGAILTTRFMESPHDFDAVHWDHEPVWVVPSVWCPAFRRPGPAKAGTPNRRFMESPHDFCAVHWDHEPTPNPSQEGNCEDAEERLLFSWEGSGVGRFMESPHDFDAVHWDHEPVWVVPSVCSPAVRRP